VKLWALLFVCAVLLLPVAQADVKVMGESTAVEVTVYNDNLGLVKDRRPLELSDGRNVVELVGVPSQIDVSSLSVKSLTDPRGFRVIEQDYQYDLVNKNQLLSKYIGKRVWFRFRGQGDKKPKPEEEKKEAGKEEGKSGEGESPFDASLLPQNGQEAAIEKPWEPPLEGTDERYDRLLSGILLVSGGEYIIMADDGRIIFNPGGQLELPALPEGLRLKPTLLWRVDSYRGGSHDMEVTYLTGGLNWTANYVAILDADDAAVDLTGWVTLTNNSGATFKDAKLKLVAGDLHRAREPGILGRYASEEGAEPPATRGVEESELYEYHLYGVDEPTTIADNETKLVQFLQGEGVAARKVYVYDSDYAHAYGFRGDTSKQHKVQTMAEVENTAANNLGYALPKGTVRVYQADADGQLQFIGEDLVDHTPRDQKIRLYVGNAFDLYAERIRTDYRRVGTNNEEDFVVTLRNAKEEPVEITVVEHLFGDWEIYQKSHPFTKKDAHTVEFVVNVPAHGETKLTYSVRSVF
jgi:hypothetical protein